MVLVRIREPNYYGLDLSPLVYELFYSAMWSLEC